MADTTGMADLRAETVNKTVTGFALASYKMKQLCMIISGSSDKESYYQETATEVTAKGTRTGKNVGRGSLFPNSEVSWTKQSSYIKKYAREGKILWEDAMTNNIGVVARTLLRISRAIAKDVDTDIWDVLTENRSVTNIQTNAAKATWDAASGQDPVEDILECIQMLKEYNYFGKPYLVVSPKDYKSLMTYLFNKGVSVSLSDQIGKNGVAGEVLGCTVIVSTSVTADYAAVVIPKECANWVETEALKTAVIENQGVDYTIRAWEQGITQLTNPKAVVLITNTQA